MSHAFRATAGVRALNAVVRSAVRLGLPVGRAHVLTLVGRTSGALRSTPVSPVRWGGRRWLVASSSAAAWVANARADGAGTLRGRGRSEAVRLVEADGEDAHAALKVFADEVARGRWLRTPPGSPVREFAADLADHPVFEVLGGGDARHAPPEADTQG
ncbi:nitroreductase/quinone reductase family protein [Streptomonospora wellingtoniae]|uniref:Nitroreductase/quinone reductase family protein n=1 Tax=Streptomonospora wellingtoniae TaxID=3075544 RepID=A0ABU2KN43_9ACTN|nr:nitroreductase/quinone reductase family protein [Streptomonospora sp. DSM 45055]MDT0300692.1 nitroreductase/quinone reductase family protein [Streptomonospora sp. DSM 45055]